MIWLFVKSLPLQAKLIAIGALIALMATVWGTTAYIYYHKGMNISAIELSKYTAKSAKLETQLTEANAKVSILEAVNLQKDQAKIKVTGASNRTIIVNKVPSQFNFSKGWISAYNASVAGKDIDASLAVDATKSPITDVIGLNVIAQNNEICLANAAQLEHLINWVNGVSANVKTVNNK